MTVIDSNNSFFNFTVRLVVAELSVVERHCRGNDRIKKSRVDIINMYQCDLIINFENDLIKMSNID